MKIERQLKQTTTIVSKTAMSDIDNDWNDFLMVRGCNWESSAEDDANKCGKKKKNNGNNESNESNCSNDKNYNKKNSNANSINNTNNTNNGNGGNGSGDSESDEMQLFEEVQHQKLLHSDDDANDSNKQIPVCSPIYISTKTKISYLNTEIDIKKIFWDIPVMPYSSQTKGIVKKQIKFSSITKEELAEIESHVQTEVEKKTGFVETQIIEHIDNPDGRIKFKDQRKINVGLCKKDILNCRCKKKRAFFNCFVLIVRVEDEMSPPGARTFKEMHIKVFNTGKLEVPGIQNDASLQNVIDILISILKNIIGEHVDYQRNKCETVLINSNFNCGYYINRDKLYTILRSNKYRIETAYDPCSYPGVKCKFYFNTELGFDTTKQFGQPAKADRTMKMHELCDAKQYIEISFMVFRTGSCLIVGNCTEKILYYVFEFIKKILHDEFHEINVENDSAAVREKKTKLRKRQITMSVDYYNTHISA
jgi:TATA-box binding protein (TBP) (component of TFIID and TFIIIB)